MSDAKESFVGFFVLIGIVCGLIIAGSVDNADGSDFIGGALIGAGAGYIAGHVTWVAVILILIIVFNIGIFLFRQEVVKPVGEVIIDRVLSDSTSIPSGIPVGAVCISNKLDRDVKFNYRWGDTEWDRVEVDKGYSRYFWWEYSQGSKSSPAFEIRIDVDFTSDDRYQNFELKRYATNTPVNCNNAYSYDLRFKTANIVGIYDTEK